MAKTINKNGMRTINGGKSKDSLDASKYKNTDVELKGAQGNDIYLISSVRHKVTETSSKHGTDLVKVSNSDGTLPSYTIGNFVEDLILISNKNLDKNVIEGNGNALDNKIYGNASNNILNGLGGDDTIKGNSGNDTISGGDGKDVLLGENGDDVLIYDANDKQIDGGSGIDTLLIASQNTTLTLSEINNLKSIEVIDLNGNSNSLKVDAISVLKTVGKNKVLRIDGTDKNTVFLSEGGWSQIENISIDGSIYKQFKNGTTIIQLKEDIVTVHTTVIVDFPDWNSSDGYDLTISGTNENDFLVGSDKKDILIGGLGNDTLQGGDAGDRFIVDAGTDTILDWGKGSDNHTHIMIYPTPIEYLIYDELIVYQGATALIFGDSASDSIILGPRVRNSGKIIVDGMEGDDTIYSSTGGAELRGGDGNDIIIVAFAGDTLIGGAGDDILYLKKNIGFMTVEGSVSNNGISYIVDAGTDIIARWHSWDSESLFVANGATAVIKTNYYLERVPLAFEYTEIFGSLDQVLAHEEFISVENAINEGTIILNGTDYGDIIIGSNGRDIITGGGNNSNNWYEERNSLDVTLNGDTLTGGEGQDIFVFDIATDSGNYRQKQLWNHDTKEYEFNKVVGSTWASADLITDFNSIDDSLNFNSEIGTKNNYIEADGSRYTSEAEVLAAARESLNGTVKYYLAYNVDGMGYLYYDEDGVNSGEVVIKLQDITKASDFDFSDII